MRPPSRRPSRWLPSRLRPVRCRPKRRARVSAVNGIPSPGDGATCRCRRQLPCRTPPCSGPACRSPAPSRSRRSSSRSSPRRSAATRCGSTCCSGRSTTIWKNWWWTRRPSVDVKSIGDGLRRVEEDMPRPRRPPARRPGHRLLPADAELARRRRVALRLRHAGASRHPVLVRGTTAPTSLETRAIRWWLPLAGEVLSAQEWPVLRQHGRHVPRGGPRDPVRASRHHRRGPRRRGRSGRGARNGGRHGQSHRAPPALRGTGRRGRGGPPCRSCHEAAPGDPWPAGRLVAGSPPSQRWSLRCWASPRAQPRPMA